MSDNDLIRRGDAIRALYDCYYYNGTGNEKVPLINFREAHGRIKKLPAVKHLVGQWVSQWVRVINIYQERYWCSECTGVADKRSNFCPNCGADMRKDGENND